MSAPVSTIPAGSEVIRRSADYHPSIWGDHFLSYTSNDQLLVKDDISRHEKLKQEVTSMLKGCPKVPETLEMIDAIQRLGIQYHFETQIDEILRNMMDEILCLDDDDLYLISLKFRLLRQHGYNMIPCDVFDKFKDENGKFKDSIVNDVRGMLSLYETTHLRTHGEEILDQALGFTIAHLQTMSTQLSSPFGDQIKHALKQPFHKGLPRLEARSYFHFYELNASCNKILLSFAKLDFNLLQKQHQKELGDITRWWKELDFAKTVSFARDRVVECYFWTLGVYFEPQYAVARSIVTKVIAITSVLDDIYDVYATPPELDLFTAAIDRWDINVMDEFPEYMQLVYKSLIDIYSEIEERVLNQGTAYRLSYAKEAMKKQVRAYFEESKWFQQKHIPTMEEYMVVALVSSGYPLLATTSLVGMADTDNVTKNTFDWLNSEPNKIVRASSTIARLMDDIVSHKVEQKRGDAASSIECYMKQYNCTEEETVDEFKERVISAWKDINGEFIHYSNSGSDSDSVPMAVLMRILNLARVMDVLYKDEDCYTNSGGVLKDFVSSLLVQPI
ncbi:(-)-germacrene D synthase-like [Euphorbia lathyris]|uniref:(-)-germacrene D synthase-like n=1 Tax=Euphorbia lathyris TaxID=212925 RepID=UPI003313EFB3